MEKSTATKPEIRAVLTRLSATPKAIARIARGRSDRQLCRKPAADAWSAQEIVAHLRACAEVWGSSIERMLAEDQPTIRYVSPRGWIKKTDFLEQGFHDSLTAFSKRRADLIKRLRAIEPKEWSRVATFIGTTLGRKGTVLSYAKRIADHEVTHLDQIRRTLEA